MICNSIQEVALHSDALLIESMDGRIGTILYVKPDVIITHFPDDYMPDHAAVSKLVFDNSYSPVWRNGRRVRLKIERETVGVRDFLSRCKYFFLNIYARVCIEHIHTFGYAKELFQKKNF